MGQAFSIPGYDAWRLREPDPGPDYSGAEFADDMPDLLTGYDITGLYDGDVCLYAVRVGGLCLTEAQVKKMLTPQHFARVRMLDRDTLGRARADYTDALIEQMGEARDDR